MSKRTKRGENSRSAGAPKAREIGLFNEYIDAVTGLSQTEERFKAMVEQLRAKREEIEADKNRASRFQSYLKWQASLDYGSPEKVKRDLAQIEDTLAKLEGTYKWPAPGEHLKKMTLPELRAYADEMELPDASKYKTKAALLAAIEKAFPEE